jgi:hypothetical protein
MLILNQGQYIRRRLGADKAQHQLLADGLI